MPYYNRDPKRDYNFDNHPYRLQPYKKYKGIILATIQAPAVQHSSDSYSHGPVVEAVEALACPQLQN